ncbi:MAG: hypothetical protein GQ525_09675 [Draconibacterium sp.]|nr:hypothetical protein [Draconibacterium sp.]
MRIFILTLIIVTSILGKETIAQKCASSLNMELIQSENPELYNRLMQIENHTQITLNNSLKSATSSNTIRIPVVVHVLHNTTIENISDDQIISQIEVLNEDYRRQNDDETNTPSEFSSIAADTEIEFFLTCIDPQGNPTTGITRTQTSTSVFNIVHNTDGTVNETATGIKFSSIGGHDAWPSSRYLNIWVCNLGNNPTAGADLQSVLCLQNKQKFQ